MEVGADVVEVDGAGADEAEGLGARMVEAADGPRKLSCRSTGSITGT